MNRSSRCRSILAAQISALLASSVAPVHAIAADWIFDGAGSWGIGTNWAGGVSPDAIDDVAAFTNNISAARVVTLDGTRTIGTLRIGDSDNTAAFTLSGVPTGGSVVFDVSAGTALLEFSGGAGIANTLTVPIVLNDDLRIAVTGPSTGNHVINGVISGAQAVTVDANGQTPLNALGQVTFAGFNTFSGGLTTTQVRVQAANAFALGTGTVTVKNTGQIFAPTAATFANDFVLTGLGWQEGTGLLGAVRSDANSTFNGNITVQQAEGATTTRFHTHTTGTVTSVINGVVSGDANVEFTKTNTGGISTWVLANDATYTGTTTIGLLSGTGTSVLQLGNGGTTGSLAVTSAVTLNADAVLAFNRRDQFTFSNSVTGAGSVTVSGTGTIIWDNGVSGYTGPTVVNGANGKLVFGTGGAYTFTGAAGAVTLSNGGDLEFNTSSNVNLSGAITGTANSYLINAGSGTVTLSGAADNPNARVMVNAGALVLGKATAATVHSVTAPGDFGVVVNGGTAQLGGTGGDQIQDSTWVQLNGGSFDLNGRSETIDGLNGAAGTVVNTNAAASTLTVGAGNAATILLGGIAFPATFAGSIQDGAGVIALNKVGTALHTLAGANTYSGATTISTGVLSVTGSLSATGAVAVNNGGTLSGTGAIGNVTMSPGSFLRPGATNTDNSAGTLTMNSFTVTGGDLRFNLGATSDQVVVNGAADFTPGATLSATFAAIPVTTPLITATAVTGTLPTLTVPAATRSTFSLSNTGTSVMLEVSGPAAQALTWSGSVDGNWNLNTTSNFNAGTERFFNVDAVTFQDGPTNRTVTLAAGLIPSSVTVNNSTGNDYTFQTGSIAGAGGIAKSGTGLLILNTANTFSGDVTVTGGTLRAGNAAALGDVNGATFVSGGGTLDINGQNLGAERIFISGTGVNGNGALINSGAGQNNATRFVILTGNATIGAANRFDVRAGGGGETLDLAGFTLTKTGASQFSVVGGRITDGNVVVNQGTFSIETSTVARGTGMLTWNSGTTAQFWQSVAANVTRPLTFNGATVTNGDQVSGVGSDITLAGNTTFNANSNVFTLTGNITETGGAQSLSKIGNNTLILAGNVSYTGTTSINNGTLQFGNGQATSVPATSAINFNGGTVSYNVNGNVTAPLVNITSSGTLRWVGATQASTLTINGPVGSSSAIGVLNITQGTANLESGANVAVRDVLVGFSGPNTNNIGTLNIFPGATLTTQFFRLGDNSGFTGIVNQTGGTVTVTAADTLDANGDAPLRIGHWPAQGSRYVISGGSLNVPNASIDIGTDGNSPVLDISGTAAVSAKRLEIDGRNATTPFGAFLYLRGGSLSVGDGGMARATAGNGNPSVNISGGALKATAPSTWAVALNFENQTAQLDTGAHDILLSGELEGPGAPVKLGTGTLTLSSVANNFRGTLAVNEGALNVTGGMTGNSTVTIASGAVLSGAGNGTTTGRLNHVVLDPGASIRPGANALDATVGTLTASSLTFNGANARFTLDPAFFDAGGTTNDLIAVSGALTVSGGTVTPIWSTSPNAGTYTLMTAGALTLNGLPTIDTAATSRQVYALATVGNDLTLTVTGASANLVWSGGLGGNAWDLDTTANWRFAAPNDEKFFAYDSVTFDNTGSANPNVNVTGTLLPGAIVVDSTANYTFSGTGTIAGGSLTKSGIGTLTLTTNNSYPGATTINAGTVRVGSGGTSGSLGTGPITNDGTIIFDRSDNHTVASPIGGSGTLVKTNTNTLTLTSASTYSGGTTISKGTIFSTAAASLGGGAVVLGDENTGADNVAYLTTNSQGPANDFIVGADGTGTATIGTAGGAAGTTFTGSVLLDRAATLQGQDTNFTGFSGVITGNAGTLTISGGRRVILQNSANDFSGDIVITGTGTTLQAALAGGTPEVIPDAASITMSTGTTFQLGFAADGTENINALNGTGTVQLNNATGGVHTLALGATGGGGTFAGVLQNGAPAPLYVTKLGPGTQTLSGAVNSTGSITVSEGVLAFGAAFGGGATKAALTTDTALDNTLTVAANVVTSDLVVGMSVTGTGVPAGSRITSIPNNTTITIAGTQTATLAGNLTFGPAPMLLRGGTFRYLGAARADDRLLDITTVGGTLEASGTGALTLSAPSLVYTDSGARTLTLAGTSTAANALAAVITDSGGPTSILKTGPGTWVLTGAGSTYTGGATVDQGVLRLGTNNKALGDNSVVTISGSGTLDVNGQSGATATKRYDLFVSGIGAPGLAAIWNSGAGVVNNPIYRSITLAGDATIGGVARYDMNGGNVDGNGVTFNGGTFSLIKVGTNELWWAPNSGATVGDILVTAGRFGVQSNNNLGSLDHQLIVNPGGQLSTFSAVSNAKPITLNGGQLHNNSAGGQLGNAGTWTGTVTLSPTVNTINTDNGTTVGGPIILNGKVTGAGGFEKIGAGFRLELGATDNDWSGDTRVTTGTIRFTAAGALSPNTTLDMNGGTIDLNSTIQTAAGLRGASGTISGGGTLTVNQATDTVFGGAITGVTNFTKTGGGTLTLTGVSPTTGETTVNAGTLLVNGTLSGTLTVEAGGRAGGTGTVNTLVLNQGGTLAPGVSPGILTASSGTFDGGTFEVELNGTLPGSGYDQLKLTSDFTLSAPTELVINLGYAAAEFDSFTLVDNTFAAASTIGAAFTVGGVPILDDTDFSFAGQAYRLDYNGGVDNNDIVLTVVPEPGSAILLLGGLSLCAAARRTRRQG